MSEDNRPQRDWLELTLRILTPLVAGLLIAWAGLVSDWTLTSISSKQESARLLTELQIRREQAESELRKDVFDQTMQAFLLKDKAGDSSIKGMSKQLLRLELLALNFGDSLSLAPLFIELRRDLDTLKPVKGQNDKIFQSDKEKLGKRLNSLARRVASTQISSLSQHGAIISVRIPLVDYVASQTPCETHLLEDAHIWPASEVNRQFGLDDVETDHLDKAIKSLFASKDLLDAYRETYNGIRLLELEGIKRYLDISISDVDHCNNRAEVTIIIYINASAEEDGTGLSVEDEQQDCLSGANAAPDDSACSSPIEGEQDLLPRMNAGLEETIKRSFGLDYFNFPIVDNTRLSNNHRFAIVLDELDLESSDPHMELIGIVFPSEYASLRDRTGMKEIRELLESALANDDDE